MITPVRVSYAVLAATIMLAGIRNLGVPLLVVLPCAVEQREVLSVGIVIANKVIEDSRIEHALQVDDGSTGDSAQEIEALFE